MPFRSWRRVQSSRLRNWEIKELLPLHEQAAHEGGSNARSRQSSRTKLTQLLHLVKALDEDQVGDLLDHLQRIREPADQKSFQMLSI